MSNINNLKEISNILNKNEIDNLKYLLSVRAIQELEFNKVYETLKDLRYNPKFNTILRKIIEIQPYAERVPEYGLAYKGRPDFMTDDLLQQLVNECEQFRQFSRKNFDQYIYQVETNDNSTIAEKLADSQDLYNLVTQKAGKVLKSYITSYLYYNQQGQGSRPHVDNAFTSITVMIGLSHDLLRPSRASTSFIYWPEKPPLEYQLLSGEMAIFFGACVLHGRTALEGFESTTSLLISYRPI